MKDYHVGISPGRPGGTAPPISSDSWAMAEEREAHCRAACPQPGQQQTRWLSVLQVPELTAVSCVCTGSNPLSSQPSKKKLHLRS